MLFMFYYTSNKIILYALNEEKDSRKEWKVEYQDQIAIYYRHRMTSCLALCRDV